MKYTKPLITLSLILTVGTLSAQRDSIPQDNIQALNHVAGLYKTYYIALKIIIILLPVLGFLGFLGLKHWISSSVVDLFAKKMEMDKDSLKSILSEYAETVRLKKKVIWVISNEDGQRPNIKKVFDKCGFHYDENCWKNISQLETITPLKVDLVLLNGTGSHPLSEEQIEEVVKKFTNSVGYFGFMDKNLENSKDLKVKYGIDIDFCNNDSRLEAGLLSILKIL